MTKPASSNRTRPLTTTSVAQPRISPSMPNRTRAATAAERRPLPTATASTGDATHAIGRVDAPWASTTGSMTYRLAYSAAPVTARSAVSIGQPRRARAAYAQVANAVHAHIPATMTQASTGRSKAPNARADR